MTTTSPSRNPKDSSQKDSAQNLWLYLSVGA